MKRQQATTGSTLILVVLFTLLILSVIMAVTMRIGLSSWQSNGDQKSTLQAQYAAESNVNLAKSRLLDIQNILMGPNLGLPTNTPSSALETYALNFCGKSAAPSTAWAETNDFATAGTGTDTVLYPGAMQCVVDNTSSFGPEKFGILADAVKSSGYNLFPTAERPASGASHATLVNWWESNAGSFNNGNIKYTITPIRAVRLNKLTYRFYLGVNTIKAQGSVNSSARYVAGSRTTTGDWWIQIYTPDPSTNVNFLNHWPQNDGGYYNDVIDGDVFTNEKFRFLFSTNMTKFKGNVNSAGCTSPPATPDLDCTKTAGFYSDYTTLQTASTNAALTAKMLATGATMAPNTSANFSSHYIGLPTNASDQLTDATNNGIVANSSETAVKVFAGDSNGNALTTYNTATNSWNEPTPTYQYFTFQNANNAITRQLRSDASGGLYQKSGTNWNLISPSFNGLLYKSGNLKVSGPTRLNNSQTSDVSKIPPAVASFSKLNLVGSTGMVLANDLTDSVTPCDNSNTQSGCPRSTDPTNILGLFAPAGDILIATTSPNNVTYHATIMASQGNFDAANYASLPIKGDINVIGSVVEDHATVGGVASLSGSTITMQNGYNLRFSFDKRLMEDIRPPSWAVVRVWYGLDASSTGKALNSVAWQQIQSGNF
ncbi:hypothetical protein [Deinococcus sp.]|uniref:hypothetical protein n=1 Tax=Deinococcus sp. TaxID=47478 RepID=UPI0025C398B3|nr:hypothetical protein [Deinococcus sp.]